MCHINVTHHALSTRPEARSGGNATVPTAPAARGARAVSDFASMMTSPPGDRDALLLLAAVRRGLRAPADLDEHPDDDPEESGEFRHGVEDSRGEAGMPPTGPTCLPVHQPEKPYARRSAVPQTRHDRRARRRGLIPRARKPTRQLLDQRSIRRSMTSICTPAQVLYARRAADQLLRLQGRSSDAIPVPGPWRR